VVADNCRRSGLRGGRGDHAEKATGIKSPHSQDARNVTFPLMEGGFRDTYKLVPETLRVEEAAASTRPAGQEMEVIY
jgi:hypothetical protein